MADILLGVSRRRATVNTVYYVLYGYYFLGLSKAKLAIMYHKHKSTISAWINSYQKNGTFSRTEYHRDVKKFGATKRDWLVELYRLNPTLYLDEAKQKFERRFNMTISISSIFRILHEEGFTWKALERRAVQIRMEEIVRFSEEMHQIKWDYHNLVFLDEVSFDSRSMLRTRGYAIRGKRLICRGEFIRRPRISLLCFINQEGMQEVFCTEGTFNRTIFFDCCKKFALTVQCYPGYSSLWILDGARIHCDSAIISYLRSLGIYVIFLPPYCPFFNPIEIVFGLAKSYMKKIYQENQHKNMQLVVAETMGRFSNYAMKNLFRKCGYLAGGRFDPTISLENDLIMLGFEDNKEKRKRM